MGAKVRSQKAQTLDDYYEFIEGRINSVYHGLSNCLGTGLFCAGEIDHDEYRWGWAANRALNRLEESGKPMKGMLVSWCEPRNMFWMKHLHLGIITQTDPVLVTHRMMDDGPIVYDEPLEKITNTPCEEKRYLVPRMLEKLI